MPIWPIKGHFWCPVVNLVPFGSNLGNLKKNFKEYNKKTNKLKKIQNQTKITNFRKNIEI